MYSYLCLGVLVFFLGGVYSSNFLGGPPKDRDSRKASKPLEEFSLFCVADDFES